MFSLILITTSVRPTQRMRTLCNDLRRVIPNAIRLNRGKLGMQGIYETVLESGADGLIIVERWQGAPGIIKLYTAPFIAGPFSTLYLASVKTQDELGHRKTFHSEPTISLDKEASPVAKHLADLFSTFLHAPLSEGSARKMSLNSSMHFSNFRGNSVKIAFRVPPMTSEWGPILIVKRAVDSYPSGNHL